MATTTITNYSVELNQGPPGNPQTYLPIRPNQFMGRCRISTFTYTAASDQNISNALCIIPQGSRILSFKYAISASSGSATFSFGLCGADGNGNIDDGTVNGILGPDSSGAVVADNTTFFGAAAANTTANTFVEVITGAANSGWLFQTAKKVYLTMTVTNTAALTTQKFTGYVMWVDD
jgi:hypothetical protein